MKKTAFKMLMWIQVNLCSLFLDEGQSLFQVKFLPQSQPSKVDSRLGFKLIPHKYFCVKNMYKPHKYQELL